MVKEVFFFTEMGYTAYPQDDARRRGYNNLMFPNEHFSPERARELYAMYFDELVYCTETGFDGIMINEDHNNPLSMMPSVNVIGAVLARATRKRRIVFLGNVLPIRRHPRPPAPAAAEGPHRPPRHPPAHPRQSAAGRGGSRDDRHPLRRSCGLRLRARARAGESGHQREPRFQPRAVRRGPRRDRQGVDHAGPVPLGGSALRVPGGQPVDAPAPEAASAHLAPGGGQPGVRALGSRASLSVRGARATARRDRRDLRSL